MLKIKITLLPFHFLLVKQNDIVAIDTMTQEQYGYHWRYVQPKLFWCLSISLLFRVKQKKHPSL